MHNFQVARPVAWSLIGSALHEAANLEIFIVERINLGCHTSLTSNNDSPADCLEIARGLMNASLSLSRVAFSTAHPTATAWEPKLACFRKDSAHAGVSEGCNLYAEDAWRTL